MVANEGYPYRDGNQCVYVASTMSHHLSNPRLAVGIGAEHGELSVYGLGFDCVYSFERPPGYIALHWTLYKWSAYSQIWLNCSSAGYFYNQNSTGHMSRERDWDYKPCGSGYYSVVATGYQYNGGWKGGGMWSGYEWL